MTSTSTFADQVDLISIKTAAERLNVSMRTIRRTFYLVKIAGRSLVRVADIQAKIGGDPHYRYLAFKVQGFWYVNERLPACNDKADVLNDTVRDFLTESPDGDVMSDAFVAYALANLPVGGGNVGDALRADIQEEAKLRGLIMTP